MKLSSILLCAAASAAAISSPAFAAEPKVELVLGIQIGFHEAIACGARAAAKEYGAAIEVQAAQNYGPADQVPLLNSVMAKSPDFIIMDPTNRTAMVAPIKEAVASGVKVIAVDTTLDDTSMLTARIGTDNVEVGRSVARALAAQLGDKTGKVIMVSSSPGISTVDQRVEGFEEEIKKFPNLTVLPTQNSGNTPAEAQTTFTAVLSANPDLIGVASPSENPTMGVASGIRAAGVKEDVAAVGVDASEAQIEAMKEGLLDALVIQKPFEMGYTAVKYAVAASKGEAVPAETPVGAVIGTRETLDKPEVADFLYKGHCI